MRSMQSTLRAISDAKAEDPQTVFPGDLVSDAVDLMAKRNIGALVVVNDDKDVIGIFSERDLLNRVVAKGLDTRATQIAEVMTPDPQCVEASMTVQEAMRKVTEERIRHLPLTTAGKLGGLISSGDLTAWAATSQSVELEGLSLKLKKHKAVIGLIIAFVILSAIGIATT